MASHSHAELFTPEVPTENGSPGLAALILIDGASDLEFDYAIPAALEEQVLPGSRVRVPMRERTVTGTVLVVRDAAQAQVRRLRPILGLIDQRPILTSHLLQLARWISDYYCSSLESVMRAMLPESVRSDVTKPREIKMVELLQMPGEAEFLALKTKAPRQAEALAQLQAAGTDLPLAEMNAAAVRGLKEKKFIRVNDTVVERDPFSGEEFLATEPLNLNPEQAVALDHVLEAVRDPAAAKPILLFGVTGSGKTEVYLQAAQRVLDMGKSVLVLVPEISLTPQTVDRFKSRFSSMQSQVAVLHSKLSEGERHDEWHRIQRGQCRIAIGARSAVFAPLENLGLILVDEEHENSYKQDSAPRYHGRDVAVMRANLEGCAIVLGSATPALESFANTQRGKYSLVRLMQRADDAKLPLIRVIDMKLEKRKTRTSGPAILSERLRMAIDQRLAKGEQTILFLNRRGFAKSILCQACSHVIGCPHCSVALTLHQDENKLVCHICGFSKLAPRRCPECRDPAILLNGYGTERVEETLRKVFPTARVARVDADAMQGKHTLRDTLRDFKARKLDIMIGTQMIAKGLHFPSVTLVGVLNSDLALNLPDFRAGERTFQLLTQVAGRAGRGEAPGEVIVQTFTPQSPSIQFSRHHDFDGFAAQELEVRRQCGFPPFAHTVILNVRSENQRKAEFTLVTLAEKITSQLPPGILHGEPVACPLERSHNQWRFHMVFRARSARTITAIILPILAREKSGKDVHVIVDVDPVDLM